MKKIVLSAALAGTALGLAACSDNTASDADTMQEGEVAETEAAGDVDAAAATGVLDANEASAEDLAGVEGVTPELAEAIVAGRPYESATAFNAALLESVGETEAATLRERIFVPINLNTATREDIELIPGMTDKMVHEFEEYRPYEDMAEFDREIGKYVDAEEVARFRNYVTL